MLKDILEEKHISSYKLAKLANLPYTTVNEIVLNKKSIDALSVKTIYALSNALNMSMDAFYHCLKGEQKQLSTSWLDAKQNKYQFPIIEPSKCFDNSRIHPLKQKEVNTIINTIINNPLIEEIYIFGGCTTIRCHKSSDVDMAIKLINPSLENKNVISEIIQEVSNYDCDILWLDKIKENTTIYNNIMKGVKIK